MEYFGDLKKTEMLVKLFSTSRSQRDESWEQTFYDTVVDASLACLQPQIINGPDGFPYFQLEIPAPGPFDNFTLRHMKNDFLLEKGLGVVVWNKREQPEWVFYYGDIVQLELFGKLGKIENGGFSSLGNGPEILKKDEEVLIGEPAEAILPDYVKRNLCAYLKQQGVPNPEITMLLRQVNGVDERDLVFNVLPSNFTTEADYRRVMNSIRWFLPRHYTYLSTSSVFDTDVEAM